MVPFWQFGLVGVLAVALTTDLQTRKIYNWLNYPAMGVGLVLSVVMGGLAGLESSLIGFFASALVFFLGWMLNSKYMGAGDVKLMAVIGIWLGWPGAIGAVLYVTAMGGLVAFFTALTHGSLGKLFKNISMGVTEIAVTGKMTPIDPVNSAAPPLPYGVSIVVGTLVALFFPEPVNLLHAIGGLL